MTKGEKISLSLKKYNELHPREPRKLPPRSEEYKLKQRLSHLGKTASIETKKKLSIVSTGRFHTEETKRKMSLSKTGHFVSEATRKKLSLKNKGSKLGPKTEEHKRKIGDGNRGRLVSEETKAKLREIALKQFENQHGPFRDTLIERLLQAELHKRGVQFEVNKRVSHYLVDILIPNEKIVIECDGCYWHCCPECKSRKDPVICETNRLYDERKDTRIIQSGYDIHRFWEHEIVKSPSDCIDRLCLP